MTCGKQLRRKDGNISGKRGRMPCALGRKLGIWCGSGLGLETIQFLCIKYKNVDEDQEKYPKEYVIKDF